MNLRSIAGLVIKQKGEVVYKKKALVVLGGGLQKRGKKETRNCVNITTRLRYRPVGGGGADVVVVLPNEELET